MQRALVQLVALWQHFQQLVALWQHFQQDRALLGLARAKKLSYIRSNSNSRGTEADEEVALSLAYIVIEDKQEAKG